MPMETKISSISSRVLRISAALFCVYHGFVGNHQNQFYHAAEAFSQLYQVSLVGPRTVNVRRCITRDRKAVAELHVMTPPSSSKGGDFIPETEDENQPPRRRKRDIVRDGLRRLAQLSLEDYEWRNSIFKTNEADRKIEESLARMMGEDPSYMRPMDASETKIGPLGRAEKEAVQFLNKVLDEESRRAKKIVKSDGELVRPIDAATKEGEELGPLGMMEKQVVDFLQSIRKSESERARAGIFRPKDLEESKRGPLGELELSMVSALKNIRESELLRMEQSRVRGGEVVRPIDVPGPLGEFEMAVVDIIRSEQKRFKESEKKRSEESSGAVFVRPKDAKEKGRLGEVELQAVQIVERLTSEEKERLRNIQRMLAEKRPMEADRNSLLGFAEALVVGILRAPQLVTSVYERVSDLLKSETLTVDKEKIVPELSKKEHKHPPN